MFSLTSSMVTFHLPYHVPLSPIKNNLYLYFSDLYAIEKRIETLVDEMGLSTQTIADWAELIDTRDYILKQRHR